MVFVAQVEKSRKGRVHFEQDISATAAVTTIGTAERNELLAEKGETAASTIAGFDVYFNFVDEFHIIGARRRVRGSGRNSLNH
jgi:hypothetical protein